LFLFLTVLKIVHCKNCCVCQECVCVASIQSTRTGEEQLLLLFWNPVRLQVLPQPLCTEKQHLQISNDTHKFKR